MNSIEKDARKWIESPTEKIDIWSVEMTVSQEVHFSNSGRQYREAKPV